MGGRARLGLDNRADTAVAIDASAALGGGGIAPLRISTRIWNVIVAGWAVLTGLAPHVLHHVGPLAGTALVAGAGGQVLFGVVGFAVTIPMLVKLRRRFHTWLAPAVALAVFAAIFSLSTFVIGPRISGATAPEQQSEATELDGHGHATPTQSDIDGG